MPIFTFNVCFEDRNFFYRYRWTWTTNFLTRRRWGHSPKKTALRSTYKKGRCSRSDECKSDTLFFPDCSWSNFLFWKLLNFGKWLQVQMQQSSSLIAALRETKIGLHKSLKRQFPKVALMPALNERAKSSLQEREKKRLLRHIGYLRPREAAASYIIQCTFSKKRPHTHNAQR